MIRAVFEPLGVRPVRLRQDRILDEARHTADPVHLVRVFGITESTAMHYVYAAYPGRQSVIPRYASGPHNGPVRAPARAVTAASRCSR
jgi:hypothetical protein